jgi:hypothetical protein
MLSVWVMASELTILITQMARANKVKKVLDIDSKARKPRVKFMVAV